LAGETKFSEKACPSATFVHHKIPHDQTRFWTRAAAVGSRRLTAWAMARSISFVWESSPFLPKNVGVKTKLYKKLSIPVVY
jgi:hypothetical protein